MTRLRFTTTETAIGPAGALVWEVGSAGAVVVMRRPTGGPSWTSSRTTPSDCRPVASWPRRSDRPA